MTDTNAQGKDLPGLVGPPGNTTVGQVLIDYSVRAESAAGALRNALQVLDGARSLTPIRPASELELDLGAVSRLVRDALTLIEGGLR